MNSTITVDNRAHLAPTAWTALADALAPQTSMERALAWFSSHVPPLAPVDLVVQDEFSFDLLVPLDDLYLSYDTS